MDVGLTAVPLGVALPALAAATVVDAVVGALLVDALTRPRHLLTPPRRLVHRHRRPGRHRA